MQSPLPQSETPATAATVFRTRQNELKVKLGNVDKDDIEGHEDGRAHEGEPRGVL